MASGILPVCRVKDQVLVLLYNATGGRKARHLVDFGGRKERQLSSGLNTPSLSCREGDPCTSPTPQPSANFSSPIPLVAPPPSSPPTSCRTEQEELRAVGPSQSRGAETRKKSRKKQSRGGDGWEDDESCAARELWEETGGCWGLTTPTAFAFCGRRHEEPAGSRTESGSDQGLSHTVEERARGIDTKETRSEPRLDAPPVQGEEEQGQDSGGVTTGPASGDVICRSSRLTAVRPFALASWHAAFIRLIRDLPVVRTVVVYGQDVLFVCCSMYARTRKRL